MNERALRVLEFTKIRDMLAAFALSDAGKEACLSLVPLSELTDVNKALDETEEAVVLPLPQGKSRQEILDDPKLNELLKAFPGSKIVDIKEK